MRRLTGLSTYILELVLAVACVPAAFGQSCVPCHEKQVQGYAKSGMARSLAPVTIQPTGSFLHKASGSTFVLNPNPATQKISRNGVSAEHSVAYIIGSGNHAYGYLVRVGDYLFQSPVSYYSRRRVWDMAPGFEQDESTDFTRPVPPECLYCHAGQPRPVARTLNRYQNPPFTEEAISCDRCHGDPAAHLRKPVRDTIINPARLGAKARASVCEQCHLNGEIRVPNPGHEIGEFHPGQELEDVFTVYVRSAGQTTTASQSIKVISHAEQLALSTCSLRSASKMWCGSCHDPHEQPADARAYYRGRCLSCHGESLAQKHPQTGKTTATSSAGGLEDCIGCHMPKRPASDGGHTAFTDHRIARFAMRTTEVRAAREPVEGLMAWREPAGALAQRNLGLANVAIGERERSAVLMETGARQLVSAMKSFPDDAAILTKLGIALLRRGDNSDAVEVYEYALRLEPDRASHHVNLATAYQQTGQTSQAIGQLEKALELDPSLEIAYQRLGEIYIQQNDPARLRQTLERYLQFMPGHIATQTALKKLNPQ